MEALGEVYSFCQSSFNTADKQRHQVDWTNEKGDKSSGKGITDQEINNIIA